MVLRGACSLESVELVVWGVGEAHLKGANACLSLYFAVNASCRWGAKVSAGVPEGGDWEPCSGAWTAVLGFCLVCRQLRGENVHELC